VTLATVAAMAAIAVVLLP